MLVLPYLIPALLFIMGLASPKSKLVTLLYLLYFWALIGLNTYTPDYESYETKYTLLVQFEDYEIGHQGLVLLCNYLGLSYQEFRMVYAFLTVFFCFIAVKRSTYYPNYVLALFLLWPFVGNVSGIRQGLANIIVCCGVPCLFKEGNKQIIKYLLWIFLAWTIHQSALFFIILIFSRHSFCARDKRLIVTLAVVGLFIMTSTQLIGRIPFIADNHKLNKWINLSAEEGADHQNLAGFLIRSFLVVCYAYLVPRLAAIIQTHCHLNQWETNRLNVCANASFLLILIIPGFVVSGEYQRFLYALLFVYYIVFAEFRFKRFYKPFHQRGTLVFLYMGLILLTVWYYSFSMSSHNVLATFKDNLLFR